MAYTAIVNDRLYYGEEIIGLAKVEQDNIFGLLITLNDDLTTETFESETERDFAYQELLEAKRLQAELEPKE